MSNSHELLTAQEVADRLRVSRQTVANWRRDGHLTGIVIGRVFRYRADEVEALVNPQRAS